MKTVGLVVLIFVLDIYVDLTPCTWKNKLRAYDMLLVARQISSYEARVQFMKQSVSVA